MEDIRSTLVKILMKVFELDKSEALEIAKKPKSDFECVRLVSQVRFLNYTWGINEPSYIFRVIGTIAVAESLIDSPKLDKQEKFIELVEKNVSKKNKIELLKNFLFSKPHGFRKESNGPHHIMYDRAIKDIDFLQQNYYSISAVCSLNCSCVA